MKKSIILFLLFLHLIAFSQNPYKFQWVKGGGSQSSATNTGLLEGCRWIGTDARGNIYGASSIFYNNIQINSLDLQNGVYLYSLVSQQGKLLTKDKLLIMKQ